ncbi:Zinc finger, CCHC-type, partial [Cynara cardunculus var. scolymus]
SKGTFKRYEERRQRGLGFLSTPSYSNRCTFFHRLLKPMGKWVKKKPGLPKAEELKFDPSPIVLSSDDEADDDLSLKIVEKAMSRARDNKINGNPSGSSLKPEVIITKVKKKIKKRKKEKMGVQDNAVDDVEIKEEGGAPKETDLTSETNPSEKSDNIVLRKLLRGPRYFDPPDSSWGNCYNCGEGGHTAVNCTSAKHKKPCFVCGSLEHNVKQCNKGKDCFICKKSGHRAKDCLEKYVVGSHTSKICLKCGDSGHEMFSCKGIYSPDDLKEIQCYVCKSFGHLCCVNYAGGGPREISCYRCGQLGHTGLKDKRKSEFSSPRKNHSRENYGSHIGVRSVPHDLGNARKRKTQYGQQSSSSQSKPRGRGGWITEDPGDWGSPKTPSRYKSNDRFNGGSGYNSGFRSNGRKLQYESTVGSNGYQHRFSASKFVNSSSYGKREYGWDY